MHTAIPQVQSAQMVHLLLVDDNEARICEVREMLVRGRIANPLRVFRADEALVILRQERACDVRRLILLNITSPQMSSFEMLRCVQEDPELQNIPVIALFSTELEKQRFEEAKLRASGYLPYPFDPISFMRLMVRLQGSWSVVEAEALNRRG